MMASEPKTGKGDIVLYQTSDGQAALEVRLDQETAWLTQRQMAELFEKDTDTIGLHIRNLYKEGELKREATTEESSVVQDEGGRQIHRKVYAYNLDVIISVGYRVKSIRGTQFRMWATSVLRDHIVRGYTLNETRLQAQAERLAELLKTVGLMGRIMDQRLLATDEATGLLQVIRDYVRALDLVGRIRLSAPDHHRHDGCGERLFTVLRDGSWRHRGTPPSVNRGVGSFRTGKGRFPESSPGRDLSELRRPGPLPEYRGKGRPPALFCDQEPCLH